MSIATVTSVASDSGHNFSKIVQDRITLIKGLGVEGDAHAGVTVQHLSRIAKDPNVPNLRQVHLIHSELFDDLKLKDFTLRPAMMGENITTRGIDLLALPKGSFLSIGSNVVIEITGLRNPCRQLNQIKDGLMNELVLKTCSGTVKRLCGVMGIVKTGGVVKSGDRIQVELPAGDFQALDVV